MERFILVFNAGSSSLKFEVFSAEPLLRSRLRGAVKGIGRPQAVLNIADQVEQEITGVGDAAEAAAIVLERLCDGSCAVRLSAENLLAGGHRVVHGGPLFAAPVRVTQSVFEQLQSLVQLAPLHNPQALAVIEAVAQRFAAVPNVAVFDTAFFSALPESVRSYALPAEWRERYGIRRYGFHGIAHQYMSQRLEAVTGSKQALGRVISLHLGQGCSATALRNGRPVETSMGFTPLEGLIMGTRCGDLDPGILFHLARQGIDWQTLEERLNRHSGLLGLSGVADDMQRLLELEAQQHHGARLALAAFYHRIHKYLGAYAAVLGGIDTIAIGGGIGENSAVIRARICAGLSWLGLVLDADANARCIGRPGRISVDTSAIEVHVVPVDEQPLIAEAALAVIAEHSQ